MLKIMPKVILRIALRFAGQAYILGKAKALLCLRRGLYLPGSGDYGQLEDRSL
jgi:hypothetical protein